MNWKEFQGKLLHISVKSVCPYGPEEDEVSVKVIETDEYITIIVDAKENK